MNRKRPAGRNLRERIAAMCASGLAQWNGKKLRPVASKGKLRGKKTVAQIVIENRK